MGWRDVLKRSMGGGETMSDATHLAVSCLLAMPPADRIALARELLAGTGRVVAREVEARTKTDNRVMYPELPNAYDEGWDECRAAMLGDEG